MADMRDPRQQARMTKELPSGGKVPPMPPESPDEVSASVTDVDPGVYGAEGDDWVYKVDESGDLSVRDSKHPERGWLTLKPGTEALQATLSQLSSGQLKKIGPAEAQSEAVSVPLSDEEEGMASNSLYPEAKGMEAAHGPRRDAKAIRDRAAAKAMGKDYPLE